MSTTLLLPWQADKLFRYPRGQSEELAREGKLPHIQLPDGSIRFDEAALLSVIQEGTVPPRERQVTSA